MKLIFVILILMVISFSCGNNDEKNRIVKPTVDTVGIVVNKDSLLKLEQKRVRDSVLSGPDSAWADIQLLIPNAKFDIRYADTFNFMKLKVYECPGCFMRLEVAKALMKASEKLDSMGFGFVFFDCYRPSASQWKLWEKMPDPRYVHPPSHGSRHSRGVAVDLSLFDKESGKILDMGTDFDYFGKEAWWSFEGHKEEVNRNRKILYNLMTSNGFTTVGNEWWHFDFRNQRFTLSDMKWDCTH